MSRAWSHSALKAFETCPKKYHAYSVAKTVSDPPSEIQQWGTDVHKAFEEYFKKGKDFPIGMKQFKAIADTLWKENAEIMTESKLALNADMQPTGFFDRDVWVRAVVDYGVITSNRVLIVDWKTGKRKKDDDQLALMAAVMFAQDENIKQVTAAFVWLSEPKGKQLEAKTWQREEVGDLWARFMRRVEVFQDAFKKQEFPPRPNGLCRKYCGVKACPYHGT